MADRTTSLKRRALILALIPALAAPVGACDRGDTCDATTASIAGVDAGGKGGGRGGGGKSGKSKSGSSKSKTSTGGGGSHRDDDCDD